MECTNQWGSFICPRLFEDDLDERYCCGIAGAQKCCDEDQYQVEEAFKKLGLGDGAVIGVVLALLLLIGGIITLIVCCCCSCCWLAKRRQSQSTGRVLSPPPTNMPVVTYTAPQNYGDGMQPPPGGPQYVPYCASPGADPSNPAGYAAQPYPTKPYPTQPYPTQPYPTQPYPPQSYPSQQVPTEPHKE